MKKYRISFSPYGHQEFEVMVDENGDFGEYSSPEAYAFSRAREAAESGYYSHFEDVEFIDEGYGWDYSFSSCTIEEIEE